MSDRPESVVTNEEGVVHCDSGPAVQYRDGYKVWALHGACVPQWLVELPGEDIDPRWFRGLTNAAVCREFVRKVGIERICYKLKAVGIDRHGDYELLLLDLGDRRRRPYLKMLNPSVGTWHMEGVPPHCRTVSEALAWRNGTDVPPEQLT
jgi:hypothetical protein